MVEEAEKCPWCESKDPAKRKRRDIGVRCNNPWHTDHPEHHLFHQVSP